MFVQNLAVNNTIRAVRTVHAACVHVYNVCITVDHSGCGAHARQTLHMYGTAIQNTYSIGSRILYSDRAK